MNDLVVSDGLISTVDLLNVINVFRKEASEKPVRPADFIAKVEDELEGEHYETFVVQNMNNTESKCALIDRDQALQVGMRESKTVRRRVREWVSSLQNNDKPTLPDFSDPVAAARAWADEAEQKQIALEKLEEAKPAIEFKEKYVEATGLMGFREVCKLLFVKEPVFRRFLTDQKIMYKLAGDWVPYQNHIDAGRFEVKTGVTDAGDTGHAYKQAKFTPKGVTWVSEQWSKHESYYLEGDK